MTSIVPFDRDLQLEHSERGVLAVVDGHTMTVSRSSADMAHVNDRVRFVEEADGAFAVAVCGDRHDSPCSFLRVDCVGRVVSTPERSNASFWKAIDDGSGRLAIRLAGSCQYLLASDSLAELEPSTTSDICPRIRGSWSWHEVP